MPNPIIKKFIVEGSGNFPFVMLNVDQCWPARAADAAAIADHQAALQGRKVIFETAAKYAQSSALGLLRLARHRLKTAP